VNNEVNEARTDQSERVIEILAEAFETDPVLNWICPQPDFSKTIFRLALPFYQIHGHVHLSSSEEGAALWLPPGTTPSLLVGLGMVWRTMLNYGAATAWRLLRLAIAMDKNHPSDPHFYLFAIGVTRAAAGQGIGSSLIGKGLAHATQENVPAYLENSNESNLGLYKKHGFQTLNEISIKEGPTLWRMIKNTDLEATDIAE
jgi:ribosomal protein S18 acetylase RimI-like enzyme